MHGLVSQDACRRLGKIAIGEERHRAKVGADRPFLEACGETQDIGLGLERFGGEGVLGFGGYRLAAEFRDGVRKQRGVLPVMKHIPGHGRAEVDSHHALPVVKARRQDLEQVDFPPFAAFADAPMAMTAHIIYTAIDRTAPATLSRKLIKSVIRGQIGFRGLLLTDDLSMKALSGTLGEKCDRALKAGCDMLLHCNGVLAEMRQVAEAAGELKGKSLRRAKTALKSARKPQAYDKKAALKDLELVVSA